jgi:type II secretory pathway pseudopilin PulG
MKSPNAARRRRGFTLVEASAILLLMLILAAIAVPVYLGVEHTNQNQAAESYLNTVNLAIRASADQVGSAYGVPCAPPDTASCPGSGPSTSYLVSVLSLPTTVTDTSGPSTSISQVSVYEYIPQGSTSSTGSQVIMSVLSQSGRCLVLYDTTGAVDTPADKWAISQPGGTCSAQEAFSSLGSVTGTQGNPSPITLS